MGIVLYRPGNTHEDHGVKCEMRVFKPSDYPAMLEHGWFTDPREMEVGEPAAATDKEIRERAKELGIRNWHNKKIDTLLNEMKPEA